MVKRSLYTGATVLYSDVIRKLSKKGQLPSPRKPCEELERKRGSLAKKVGYAGEAPWNICCRITGAYSFLEVNRDYK